MSELVDSSAPVILKKYKWYLLGIVGILIAAVFWPRGLLSTLRFVLEGMLEVSYLVIPGIVISAWVNASGVPRFEVTQRNGSAGGSCLVQGLWPCTTGVGRRYTRVGGHASKACSR